MTTLPESVRIVEVGPRDGLQNQPETVSTRDKVEFIRQLTGAGIGDIEATSFVRRDRVPQLADAEALLDHLDLKGSTRFSALVPNMRGLERALETDIPKIAILTAASETFNQKNIGMSIDDSFERLKAVVARARAEGLAVRGYVSTCWVCPFEGDIPPDAVVRVIERLFELGVGEVSVGDTVGAATPDRVETTLRWLLRRFPADRLAMHFHDTYGMAVANVWQSLQMGITTFDSSAGGLGGCPYAPGAMGNVATEDLVYLFDRVGIRTGVRLAGVRRASEHMAGVLGRPLPSRVLATPAGRDGQEP